MSQNLFDEMFLKALYASIRVSEVVREFVTLEKSTIRPKRSNLQRLGLTRKEMKAFMRPHEELRGTSELKKLLGG